MLKASATYCLVYSLRISSIAFLTTAARYVTIGKGVTERAQAVIIYSEVDIIKLCI